MSISVTNRFVTGLAVCLTGGLLACSSPRPTTEPDQVSLKRLVFMAELKDDPAIIARYEQYHQVNNLWPEINQAAQAAGFTRIAINRFGNRLVMVQEFPAGSDKQKMDSLYVASSPKLKAWGELMATLQQAPPGAQKGEVWVEMKEIYRYPNP